ncbi:MAG: hypothetical protein QNI91_06590 [Arenicellales bacterium]|nr:hypothetical protein [Arenicellales bacterium]
MTILLFHVREKEKRSRQEAKVAEVVQVGTVNGAKDAKHTPPYMREPSYIAARTPLLQTFEL